MLPEVGNDSMYSLPQLVLYILKPGLEEDITCRKTEFKELSKKL
ncbi:hypothetical protein QUA81_06860 [Microcoleus sp. F6_B4]